MKFAISGYGKTGKVVAQIAQSRGHSIVIIDPHSSSADHSVLDLDSLKNCDACIDFTQPQAAVENIKATLAAGIPMVMGTTGWYDNMENVQKLVQKSNTAFIYASNFSIGVLVFNQIVSKAAQIIDKFESYDIAGIEQHHNQKADSPSGTAQTLSQILLDNISRKTSVVNELGADKVKDSEIVFSSVRCGSIPGTHEIIFDSEADTISLKHSARNRSGFALGAVMAAEWISGKRGFYTINDFFKDLVENAK